ncbi:MAG: zinc ABC transporter substrate-binding protein [Deltaproteobacteria bacterium]|nr:zinc ABC transporter substrate-binding protein [Deltaproteobacteria bacterium]
MKKIFCSMIVLAMLGSACTKTKQVAKNDVTGPIRIVTTTGMIGDLVKNIGGERVEVLTLMGAGVDPHLYKASAGDIRHLQEARMIFYNGLNLEGKMGDIFVRVSRDNPFVIPVTEDFDHAKLLEPPAFQGHFDPHVWFDVTLWAEAGRRVQKALEVFDPAGSAVYQKNGEVLQKRLTELHKWSIQKASELPKIKRVLVTSHDAYNYFGRAYGFEVIGLQGISTVTQAGLADIANMVDFILKHKVKAVFVETSVSPKAIQRVEQDAKSRGWPLKIGGELFSDAMGKAGSPEGTYEGMIRHNMNTIVENLK